MIEAVYKGYNTMSVYGLTQYDYGQVLCISDYPIADGTEIHFCQDNKAVTQYLLGNEVLVPDYMLQHNYTINAYVYINNLEIGETVLKIILPVTARERPGDYIVPEEPAYIRLIPPGGVPGQFLAKATSNNFDTAWADAATNIVLQDGALQLMSGDHTIGDRIRLPTNGEQREIEIKNNGTHIAWRYTDSNDWNNLVRLQDLKGTPGETPEFEIRNGTLYAIYGEEN